MPEIIDYSSKKYDPTNTWWFYALFAACIVLAVLGAAECGDVRAGGVALDKLRSICYLVGKDTSKELVMEICKVRRCKKEVKAKGYCSKHYQQMRRCGEILSEERERNPSRGCEVSGCSGKHYSRGYCMRHYGQMRWHGKILASEEEINRNPPKTCTLANCENGYFARGFCEVHYQRFRKYGDPTVLKQPKVTIGICTIDDCGKAARTKGLCRMHYEKRWGEEHASSIKAIRRKHKHSTKGQVHSLRHKLKMYNMSLGDYEVMWLAQNGVCAICEEPEIKCNKHGERNLLCVDHDHDTGEIRGLLCWRCNMGLGYFRNNTSFLLNAGVYLENANRKAETG